MNKITSLLVTLCIVLSSCITEFYDAPEKTYVGRVTAAEVSNSIIGALTPVDIAIKANMWFSAESLKEKYEIEDKFFDGYKLRIIDDTIRIIDLCDIITSNSFLEQNNAWKIKMKGDYELGCKRVVDSTWEVKPIVERWGKGNHFLLSIELKSGNYIINGEGYGTTKIYFNSMRYLIEQPLLIPYSENLFIDNHRMYDEEIYENKIYHNQNYINGGILSITAFVMQGGYSEKEHINAEYSEDGVKITAKENSHFYSKYFYRGY